ncbi:DUF2799 domain-containing protein [bacterium]|nr:DUF2799 domain-containing protein [bacterium]
MKRKECEKTNWFEFGHQAALKGIRPPAEPFYQECKKVEADIQGGELDKGFKTGMAKYCTPQQAIITGKEGMLFNDELCDARDVSSLKIKHAAGLKDYCSEKGGQRAGLSGKLYTKVCNDKDEELFFKGFNPARKKYLIAEIAAKERTAADVSRRLSQKQNRYNQVSRQSSRLQSRLYKKQLVTKTDTSSGVSHSEFVDVENPQVRSQLNMLNSESNTLSDEIRRLEAEEEALSESIQKLSIEMQTL